MTREELWNKKYELLKKYYNEHGNINVPVRYVMNGVNLGSWLIMQRQAYNGNFRLKISVEHIEKLNELGMDWNPNETLWEEKYKLLKEYKESYGNVDVPIDYEVNGIKLGGWIREQRNAYKGIGTCKITKEQIKKLNDLGIKWNYHSENWDKKYELLKEYYDIHGNIDLPVNYKIEGINLSCWLNTQRRAYKGFNTHKITKERIAKLNELGMKWDLDEYNWNKYYKLLEDYYLNHGNIDVPFRYQVGKVKLGFWLNSQRTAYKKMGKHKITEEKIEKLNKLGMKWNVYDENWNRKYELLKKYYNEHGNVDVPLKYVVGEVNLGTWLNTQRMAYKKHGKSNITEEQINKLNELGIKWTVCDDTWDKNYELLKKYKEEFGNIDIPQNYEVDGIKLGSWLAGQKSSYKGQGSLVITPEHIKLLNDLDIDWSIKETIRLNRKITNMEIYNIYLFRRTNFVLKDLLIEEINEIDSNNQKEIEKILIKRIWR